MAVDRYGAVRVGGTRVTFTTVISALKLVNTPEEIAESYEPLHWAEVDSVIGYFLRWRDEIDEYLRDLDQQAQTLR